MTALRAFFPPARRLTAPRNPKPGWPMPASPRWPSSGLPGGGLGDSPSMTVQVRAARLPPLQDGELVAQDQDLCGLPRLLTPRQLQPCDHAHDQ